MEDTEKELLSMLNDENVKVLAEEIVNEIVVNGNEDNLEIDYQLSKGKMISLATNAIFSYIYKSDTWLGQLCEKAQKVEALSYEAHDVLLKFEIDLANEINKNHIEKIKNKIRQFTPMDHNKMDKLTLEVRENILRTIFPMYGSKIISCVLNLAYEPDSDGGYTIKVIKNSPKGSISTTSVANDLIKRNTETGKTYEDIIKEQKSLNNDQYKYVVSAEKKYYDANCVVSMYINFNPAPQKEVEETIGKLFDQPNN